MRTGLVQMRRGSLLLSPWNPQCTFTVAPPRIVAVQVIHPGWWGGVECYRNRGCHAKKRERQKLVHGAWRVRGDGMRGGVQNIMPSLFSCIQVSLPVADFQWILAAGCLQHLSFKHRITEQRSEICNLALPASNYRIRRRKQQNSKDKKAGKEKQGEGIIKRAEGEAEEEHTQTKQLT